MGITLATFETLVENNAGLIVTLFFFVALLVFGILWHLLSVHKRVSIAKSRERTRRELAAYVAEGSMTAEEARMLAGPELSEAEEDIHIGLACGQITPKKAAEAIRIIRDEFKADTSAGSTRA